MIEQSKMASCSNQINGKGFAILPDIFTEIVLAHIIQSIERADQTNSNFRKTDRLFAIRQFVKEVPEVLPHIFTKEFVSIITEMFGKGFFLVKSVYFDKPDGSNWFVSYHQDLTISVNKKLSLDGFGPWSAKQNQYAVQPPLSILENNFTIRIHLDDTDEKNGALKIIAGSHNKGVIRPDTIDLNNEDEIICNVPKGGIMIMRPLLLHASGRTVNQQKRRVIHLEFSKQELPEGIHWAKKYNFV